MCIYIYIYVYIYIYICVYNVHVCVNDMFTKGFLYMCILAYVCK